MKVAAVISSYNNPSAVRRCFQALVDQTFPLQEIIIVDNCSTDGFPERDFPGVTLLCNLRNLGKSGSIATAMQYALQENYDWLWDLDQDSVPNRNALELLVQLYGELSSQGVSRIGVLTSRIDTMLPPFDFFEITPNGFRKICRIASRRYSDIDCTIWSGSLFNLKLIQQVGLPRVGLSGYWEDFSLDWGDFEYSYRIKQAGWRQLVHWESRYSHAIGSVLERRLFGHVFRSSNHAAFRRYLYFRNCIYFWFYIYNKGNRLRIALFIGYDIAKDILKIIIVEKEARWQKVRAALRGIRHGLSGNLHGRP